MFPVAAEFQNVPLRDAHVLEQHPGRVGKTSWFLSPQPGRETGNRFFHAGMCAAAFQQFEQVLSQRTVVVFFFHSRDPLLLNRTSLRWSFRNRPLSVLAEN